MRILVTGGAGFLGSHLCDALLEHNHEVICMDNFSTSHPDNIGHLFEHERFSFLKYNVCDYLHVDGALDGILHFASPASPQDYLELPIATLKVGALGTHKVLGLARWKKARFVLASTSEVYGDPLVNPQPESYWGNVNPLSPRGVYDEAKRFAEAMTMAYHRFHGIDTRIVRIFNTYGPRMREKDGRVISNFIVQALKGEPLTVYGEGLQTRSFCFVDDLVKGIVSLLEAHPDPNLNDPQYLADVRFGRREGDTQTIHYPVNLGNPAERTVLDIAKTVIELSKSESKINHHPLPVDDPKVRRPDITQARKLLNWEPKVNLEEGLTRTISYFKKMI
ncbi:MAG: SDR family oxidoreductase [Nitrospirae bacterium]|nr:SDR family oxidoreductase [Nitrospirota bacterium]